MTHDQLVTRAKLRYGDPNAAAITDSSYWSDTLNERYWQFLADAKFPQEMTVATLSFAAADQSKALATGVFEVESAVDTTNHVTLHQLDTWREAAEFNDRVNVTGQPRWYKIINADFHVYPTPTSSLTITVVFPAQAAALATSASPILPLRYHGALVDGMLATAYADDDQAEKAAYHESVFKSRISQAKDEFLGPRGESYVALTDTFHKRRRRN